MKKFTLPAGTTNRHQWHKKAAQAITTLDRIRFERVELNGVKGGEERSHIISTMFGGTENETAETLLIDIGERFDWLITKENAEGICAAVLEALPEARDARPVDDSRESPNERAERIEENNKYEETRQAERGQLLEQVDKIAEELRAEYPWAVADNGKLSGYARAAKNMKIELGHAFPGVKFSVTSESFSMGNSVSVSWSNGPSAKSVDAITDKYQYYIDKCTDDNSARAKAVGTVLGQSKYVSTSREIAPELREQVGRDICKEYGEEYDTNTRIGGRWLSDAVWKALQVDVAGAYSGVELIDNEYQAQFKAPEPGQVSQESTAPAHLEEHVHTKKGFTTYMVVPDNRLERDDFNRMRDDAKAAGGWYSRKWGATPGGFAFEVKEQAETFLASLGNSAQASQPRATTTAQNGDKFRALADKMTDTIADKFADRRTNTAKQIGQARGALFEGEKLKRTQAALYALAGLQDTGTVPAVLAGLNSKKAVYDLMGETREQVPNGYHSYMIGTGKPCEETPQTLALWALLTEKTPEELRAEDLARRIEGLQFSKIPGYFPTPAPVINTMLEYADIREGNSVLEPSAGSGAIADAVKSAARVNLHCSEANHTLREILTAKGYDVGAQDFLTYEAPGVFDRVVMNPPFENLQDIEHVRHAFDCLKDGGRVVSVMSPAPFYRTGKKAEAFRAWFDKLGGEKVDLPDNSFKESGTGVASCLVILDKEAA